MKKDLFNGLFTENPILVLAIGLCPALAVTTSLEKALAISLALIAVLVSSSLIISLIRKIIPECIQQVVCLIIITTFTTIVNLFFKAYLYHIHTELGVYLALVAVNYVIIDQNISYSLNNNVFKTFLNSLCFGIGCVMGLSLIAVVRESLGLGTITVWEDTIIDLMPIYNLFGTKPSVFFVTNAGAFLCVGLIIGVIQMISHYYKKLKERKVV